MFHVNNYWHVLQWMLLFRKYKASGSTASITSNMKRHIGKYHSDHLPVENLDDAVGDFVSYNS